MNILHICNDFSYSKVYKNLYQRLDLLGFKQFIFHPLRDENDIGKNCFDFQISTSTVFYSRVIRKYHKIFFKQKINFLWSDLIRNVDVKNVGITNATTLFSDGLLALRLKKKYGIPYIVTPRHTDVVLFLKFRPDLLNVGLEILKEAEKIIFITPALKKRLFNHSKFRVHQAELATKMLTIPNGVDDFWLDNLRLGNTTVDNKFLYIGTFEKRKNLVNLIYAFEKVKAEFPDVSLTLVGGGGGGGGGIYRPILEMIDRNQDWITYLGRIEQREKLLEVVRSHKYFSMTSFYETFGLVYIEALTQGLPLVYTEGHGVDGLIEPKIGVPVNPKDVEDIKSKIIELITNDDIDLEKVEFQQFSWDKIGLNYSVLFSPYV